MMKKKIYIGLGLIGLIVLSISIGVYAAGDIKLFINGKAINADIQVVNGSSYVPLRVVTEELGGVVKWDGDARTISITSGTPVATPAPVNPAKSFPVSVDVESGSMKMHISKVTLDPAYKAKYSAATNAIVLDVTIENTSSDTINWYPSYGTIVLNTKEQTDGMKSLTLSDDVDGTFNGKVVKTGKIAFEVKSDLTTVNSISYIITGPHDPKTGNSLGEDKTTELILK
jgi:hypothetical protein